ncbi:MAG: hypothetical protein MUF62_04295 [Chitinophagaceae bacterium]|jgi:hypothetical protein|nr:hypothetical protein [Chitinophagaceae bacterium]
MATRKKTWVEKRELANALAKKEVLAKGFADIPAGATMLVPTPKMVDAYVRQLADGIAGSLAQMRKDLAAAHGAQYSCPVTSGIFLRTVAEAAWEELQAGKKLHQVAPFWRIIPPGSPTAKKLSFGTDFLLEMRAKEKLDMPKAK